MTANKSEFELSSPLDDYIQLSPIGLFPHSRGLQNVDRTALENLVKNFKSFFSRLGRRFAGLPFYVGHPDVHGFENTYTDRKAYGWIMDLQVRDDGLYGRTKWSDAGRELISNGHFKFLSPTWTAEKVGSEQGRPVFRPTQLVSVGLTNEPNLPVPPLANTECTEDEETLLGTPMPVRSGPGVDVRNAKRSFVAENANRSEMTNNQDSAANDSAKLQMANAAPPAPPCSPSSMAENSKISALDSRITHLETNLKRCEAHFTALQSSLITNVLDNAIAATRILPAERKLWQNQLTENFNVASAALANAKPQLNLTAKTDSLPVTKFSTSAFQQKTQHVQSLINDKMHREGLSYDEAWIAVNGEHPDLFAQ